jgi:methyl-accepting chemotaxis protein
MIQKIEESISSISTSSGELFNGTKHIVESFETIQQVA